MSCVCVSVCVHVCVEREKEEVTDIPKPSNIVMYRLRQPDTQAASHARDKDKSETGWWAISRLGIWGK